MGRCRVEDCQKSRGNLDMKWIMYAMHLPFRGSDAVTRGDVAGDREGWMRIAALRHVTAGENDRERPLYSARLGVGTRSVHKYRVQRRHQQFIAIISGVLTALSATEVLGGGCNGRCAERSENGLGWRSYEREREGGGGRGRGKPASGTRLRDYTNV
ncbi:hypothetical protein ALC60_14756 [Trachymyrmex zeteki]|uniref:Uncharacterized protein n=1 Tax=Mycetomoellerius zeteki TaxID=64791 RepID=A0A151WEP9_9HYME|nr:hypothetical protein ALC60_14756 [Trachymyrmex zeteki]